jgi:tagaturonate reductase
MNPYVHHALMSIALNSISKFKERDLPTIMDDYKLNGSYPAHLTYAMASLIKFYAGQRVVNGVQQEIKLNDDPSYIAFFKEAWDCYNKDKNVLSLVDKVLSKTEFWGKDLTKEAKGLDKAVAQHLSFILAHSSCYEALKEFNSHE